MEIIKKISLDMGTAGVPPYVDAVQGESFSRIVEITTLNGGVVWTGGDGTASIAYKKPDGTSGWYDTLPNGESAITASDDGVWQAVLAPEMLTVPGDVCALMRFDYDGEILATFPFIVRVAENPSFGSAQSENYYNVQNWDDVNLSIEELWEEIDAFQAEIDTIPLPPYAVLVDYYPGDAGAGTEERYEIFQDFSWEAMVSAARDVDRGVVCRVNPADGSDYFSEYTLQSLYVEDNYASFVNVEGSMATTLMITNEGNISTLPFEIGGSGGGGGVQAQSAVLYVPQQLSDVEKRQARSNIGAAGEGETDGIPTPSTAEVGQTVVVSAVDENGKPTEWEAADLPSGGSGCSEWELINELITTDEVTNVLIDKDTNGNTFDLEEIKVTVQATPVANTTCSWYFYISSESTFSALTPLAANMTVNLEGRNGLSGFTVEVYQYGLDFKTKKIKLPPTGTDGAYKPQSITRFAMKNFESAVLPVGTHIVVFGKRVRT